KFFSPIRDLSAKYSVMQGAMAALERLFNLLDCREILPEAPSPSGPQFGSPLPKVDVPFIRFRDVWFAYKEDDFVLKAFNLELEKGEKIALVGETGGGKTTVTRLLSRLYDV